ncbi:hypothetical protein PG997_000212 [Apiospora hydei]|uniref:FAD-binding PCMH-type domain-containing protein n=1 Tax=Apiospora hydei TaxID=1337664 RepID=A0ABR1XAC6_9PEZI
MSLHSMLFSSLAIGAQSQAFELANFNVTDALVQQGVNLSALPELAPLADRSSDFACHIACDSLQTLYGADAVDYDDEPSYTSFTGAYWSTIPAEVKPSCIFRPSTPASVSVLVLIARLSQCPFAVKSGGHSAFAGGASIEGGVTVSLENLREVRLAADRETVAVQPGNTWSRVLSKLNDTGAGLTYGLVCDNVASFDVSTYTEAYLVALFPEKYVLGVVTASGVVVNASPTQFPDLYWALRGGGNNFGIVVSFNMMTRPLPNDLLFGGTRVFAEANFPQVAKAYIDMSLNSAQDPKAGGWVVWLSVGGQRLALTELWYAAPLAAGADAPLLSAFYDIEAVSDSTKTRGHAEYVRDGHSFYGQRQVYYVLSVKLAAHPEFAARTVDVFWDAVGGALGGVKGVLPLLIWQHVTEASLKASKRNGGIPWGLIRLAGLYLSCSWRLVYKTMSDIMKQIKQESRDLGIENDWVYMNYASQYQDVIASYGAENKERLKRVAEMYDPRGVFQTLQPGYFKLDRAAKPDARYFSH